MLENDLIQRTWEYKNGYLYTISILNKRTGMELINRDEAIEGPEFSYEGLTNSIRARDKQYPMELI
mgnify:CR=1 FL=1